MTLQSSTGSLVIDCTREDERDLDSTQKKAIEPRLVGPGLICTKRIMWTRLASQRAILMRVERDVLNLTRRNSHPFRQKTLSYR
jgi:hypothetical protein